MAAQSLRKSVTETPLKHPLGELERETKNPTLSHNKSKDIEALLKVWASLSNQMHIIDLIYY